MDDFSLRSNLEEEATPFVPSSLVEIMDHIQRLRDEVMTSLPANQLSHSQIQSLLENLPRLTGQELTNLGHKDSLCPICLNPYLAILAEEEMALAMDSPAHPVEKLGVARLSQPWQCGHVFCRRDISKWIEEAHDSCPLCRHLLIKPNPNTEAAEPVPQANNPLADLERQIGAHIDLLQSRVRDMRASYESDMPLSTEAAMAQDDDRSQFSGMYS